MKKRKFLPLLFLLFIPITIIIDIAIFKWGVDQDLAMAANKDPDVVGHPAPAFIILAMALVLLISVVGLVITIVGIIVSSAIISRAIRKEELGRNPNKTSISPYQNGNNPYEQQLSKTTGNMNIDPNRKGS